MRQQKVTPILGKVVYYRNDGTARDHYISQINGGLLTNDRIQSIDIKNKQQYQQQKHQKLNMTFNDKFKYRTPPTPTNINPVHHYRSDGSGRDYYITINEGGQANQFSDWKNDRLGDFKRTIRNYEPIRYYDRKDLWSRTRRVSQQRQRVQDQKQYLDQSLLVERLSKPKEYLYPGTYTPKKRYSLKNNTNIE